MNDVRSSKGGGGVNKSGRPRTRGVGGAVDWTSTNAILIEFRCLYRCPTPPPPPNGRSDRKFFGVVGVDMRHNLDAYERERRGGGSCKRTTLDKWGGGS